MTLRHKQSTRPPMIRESLPESDHGRVPGQFWPGARPWCFLPIRPGSVNAENADSCRWIDLGVVSSPFDRHTVMYTAEREIVPGS